jgi:hypothetical protein
LGTRKGNEGSWKPWTRFWGKSCRDTVTQSAGKTQNLVSLLFLLFFHGVLGDLTMRTCLGDVPAQGSRGRIGYWFGEPQVLSLPTAQQLPLAVSQVVFVLLFELEI